MSFLDRIRSVKIKESAAQEPARETPRPVEEAVPVAEAVPTADAAPVVEQTPPPAVDPETTAPAAEETAPAAESVSPQPEAAAAAAESAETSPAAEQNIPVAAWDTSADDAAAAEEPVEPSPQPEAPHAEKLQELADSLAALSADMKKLAAQSERQGQVLKSIADKDGIIKDMHGELMEYRDGFKQEIMKPMVKSVIRLYDRLVKLSAVYEAKFAAEENLPQVCRDFASEVSSCAEVILSSLAEFDIERIQPEPGAQFDPKRHRCVKTEPVAENAVPNTISGVLKAGFENIETGRIIEYPEVVVVKEAAK